MRLRRILKTLTWTATSTALGFIVLDEKTGMSFLPALLFAALAAHFGIEAGSLLAQARRRRRLAGLGEYRAHERYAIGDLAKTLEDEASMEGMTLPAILEGRLDPSEKQAAREAPLSRRRALAWKLEAEFLEGLFQLPGPAIGPPLAIDAWWGGSTLDDGTGKAAIAGPGLLDGASCVERVLGLAGLRAEFPALALRVTEGLGLTAAQESPRTRILLREVALLPGDQIRAYGLAKRGPKGLLLSGNDILDDPGSLLLRAVERPASSRLPRRTGTALALSSVALVTALGAGVFGWEAGKKALTAPGALLDSSRTASVHVDLDGRELELSIAGTTWNFDEGDTRTDIALTSDNVDFLAPRNASLKISTFETTTKVIRNGDAGYPRWDGKAWTLDLGEAGGGTQAESGPRVAAARGRLYIRNLAKQAITLRILDAAGEPVIDTSWKFAALEGADSPKGQWLSFKDSVPLLVDASRRVEILMKSGARRVLSIGRDTTGLGAEGWLLSTSPELLAGEGKLYVRNSSASRIKLWLLGSGDAALFGNSPWPFAALEGMDKDRGLSLESEGSDIVFTGRESVKLGLSRAILLADGTIEGSAKRDGKLWRLEAASFRGK